MAHLSPDVLQLACKPIPLVRIGFVGLGSRGQKTLSRYLGMKGVEIVALCDLLEENVNEAYQILQQGGLSARRYHGQESWKRLCNAEDIDLVFICTDWMTHVDLACYTMKQGKHVALEVPAAMTVADCWRLVDTAEETQQHCMMVENCCYDPYNLMALNMVQEGLLGDITHAEGAYIHDLRNEYARNAWMKRYNLQHVGNFYPTHGLGPICQQMNIHRGDRLDYLISLSTDVRSADMPAINNTLIKTGKGRSILLQYDVTTPRPYSRLQTTCGTKGFLQKYPTPTLMLDGDEHPRMGEQFEEAMQQYQHLLTRTLGQEARDAKVENEMNYIMDRRLIHCLQNGLPLDQDVYDAAEWSCVTALSEQSIREGGRPIEFPDFTRGRWNKLSHYEIMF